MYQTFYLEINIATIYNKPKYNWNKSAYNWWFAIGELREINA